MSEVDETPVANDDDMLSALVTSIDPALSYPRDLHPAGTTCRTLLVEDEGARRLLKVRRLSQNLWDDSYFHLEIHALRRVEERKLSNITQLVHEYVNDTHHAILKSYAEGTPANTLDHAALLLNPDFIAKLDALYLKLHLAGVAKVNYLPRKLVIADDGELILVDLSTCVVNTEVGVLRFVQEMRADSRFVTQLEKKAKRAA